MNTYNENLRLAVSTSLTDIDATEQQRQSALTVAHYNLYYAVGEQILAQEKLDRINVSYEETDDINAQGVSCSNRADNLLDSATMADQNVDTLVTNSATAAQNVQVAANAVVKLAADVGAANNIVNASEFDTDIMRMTIDVNNAISQTAYLAEAVSKTSMDSSADSAQIIAKEVLQEATTTQQWFSDMLARTSADLDKLTQARIADTNDLIAANSNQRRMEGRLGIAGQEVAAVESSYEISNSDMNLSLTAKALTKNTATVQFEKMNAPFPFVSGSDSTKMDNEYYVCVSKSDTQAMFTTDVAQTSFNAHGPGNDGDVRFAKVSHTIENTLQLGKGDTGLDLVLLKDIDGDDIVPGTLYVVFLYTVLDPDYKREVNNYSDALSAASQSFTMTTALQSASTVTNVAVCELTDDGDLHNLTVNFAIDPDLYPDYAEYRVILVPNETLCQRDGEDAGSCQARDTETMKIWFDTDIALQVAEVNYKLAQKSDSSVIGCPADKQTYEASFSALDSDNFGQLLIPGDEYVYWVLAVVTELNIPENEDTSVDAFTPKLTQIGHGVLGEEQSAVEVDDSSDDNDGDDSQETNVIEQQLAQMKQQAETFKRQVEQVEKDKKTLTKDKQTLAQNKANLEKELDELKKQLSEKTTATTNPTTAAKTATATKTTTAKRNTRGGDKS